MKTIDIHTHGIGGYDTRTGSEEHILKIAEIHGSRGVSEILLTIYPSDIKVMRENMEAVKKAIKKQQAAFSFAGSGPREAEAKIMGVHLEGPFLNPGRYGALNPGIFLQPDEHKLKELIEGFEDIVKIITIAPELDGASALIKKTAGLGIIASMGHSDATYAEAESGFHAGARGITHIFNAMRGIHHREPGIAGFGLINKDIYIEVIADPYHLHQKTVELIFKTKSPERIMLVSDSVRETKTSRGNQALTDAHGKLLGGCMTVSESAKRLVDMGYEENLIADCVTKNVGTYLSLK